MGGIVRGEEEGVFVDQLCIRIEIIIRTTNEQSQVHYFTPLLGSE